MNDNEYDEAVADMKQEKKKQRGVNFATVKELMEVTLPRRRKWIMEKSPLASDILDTFPFLADTKIVSITVLLYIYVLCYMHLQLCQEFCTISGSERFTTFVSIWGEWVEKIFKFGQIEAKNHFALKKWWKNTKDSQKFY